MTAAQKEVAAKGSATTTVTTRLFTGEEAFGLEGEGAKLRLVGYEAHPNAPKKKEHFWDLELLNDLLIFWSSKERALMLNGHTGTGKTSSCVQFHASLNMPLLMMTASADSTKEDLKGQWVMGNGNMVYRLSNVMLAAQNGWSVLVNEYNMLHPEVSAVINDLLDGNAVDIPEAGIRVVPKEGFRLFATQNPNDGINYLGRQDQDSAHLDRFFNVTARYLPTEVETKLLAKLFDSMKIPSERYLPLAESLVDVANTVRKQFTSSSHNRLMTVISTRKLEQWARFTIMYDSFKAKGISPVHIALKKCLTDSPSVSETDRTAIHEYVTQVFGVSYSS